MFLGRQDRRSGSTKWAAHSASPSHQPKTHQCWANATARQSGLTQCIGKTLCELPSLEPVIACSHWCFGAGDDRLRRKAAVAFVGEVGAKRATKPSPEMLNLTHQFCGRVKKSSDDDSASRQTRKDDNDHQRNVETQSTRFRLEHRHSNT